MAKNNGPKIKNDPTFPVNIQYFMGGSSLDYKMGIANGFYSSHNLDFRTFPSQMSVLPGNQAIATNLSDLILAIDMDLAGVRYAVGSQGYIYRINTSDQISTIGKLNENGSAGLLYSQITDSLYIPGQTTVSMYSQVSSGIAGSPTMRLDQFGPSASYANGTTNLYNASDGLFDTGILRNNAQTAALAQGITLQNYQTLITNSLTGTYQIPSAISEVPTQFCFFAPDIEPFYSIAVFVTTVGSGNWTLTLHNSLNEPLASVTIANGNMVKGWNNFVFGSQIRAFVNAANTGIAPTYHFHLTSSVANDTAAVATVDANDLSGVNFLLFAYRLVETNNGWHPTAYFTGTGQPLLCIGNGNYVSTYNFGNDADPNNSQWQRHALTFKPGEEVTSMSVNNQYLCIFTERRSTDANRNYQVGTMYLWDGSTNAPNIVITIPMGSPYGAYTLSNITYFVCAGALYAWSQGVQVVKVRKLAYQNTDYMNAVDQTRVNPNALTSRYNILMMGYPSFTTDPNIDYGIWSYGAVELTFPNSYGYSYSQSIAPKYLTYTTQNNLQSGCCVNFVDSMYSSWAYTDSNDVTHYGLDLVNNSSPPATWFDWSYLIYDGSVEYKQKNALRYRIGMEPLPTGYTVTANWTINRTQSFTGATATVGANNIFSEVNNARFHEIQWGFSGTQTGATEPAVFLSVAMDIDPLENERNLGAKA